MDIDTKQLKEMTQNLNVLFVEDDTVVQMLTTQILEVFFKSLVVKNNGQEGLDAYNIDFENGKSNYDLVITDVSMPKLSGIAMAKAITEKNPNQHFIFISAHQDNDYARELDGKGYYSSISKPVTLDSLKSVFFEAASQFQANQP